MSTTVAVQKATDQEKAHLEMFQEIEKRLDEVRRRAFELFEGRGGELGRELEDWLRAENDVFGEARVDFQEKPGQFVITVTLPGFDVHQARVSATPTEIAIHASRKDEGGTCEVYRRFELPKPGRTDQVTARLENGALHIVAPSEAQGMSASGPQVTVAVA